MIFVAGKYEETCKSATFGWNLKLESYFGSCSLGANSRAVLINENTQKMQWKHEHKYTANVTYDTKTVHMKYRYKTNMSKLQVILTNSA